MTLLVLDVRVDGDGAAEEGPGPWPRTLPMRTLARGESYIGSTVIRLAVASSGPTVVIGASESGSIDGK